MSLLVPHILILGLSYSSFPLFLAPNLSSTLEKSLCEHGEGKDTAQKQMGGELGSPWLDSPQEAGLCRPGVCVWGGGGDGKRGRNDICT